MNHINKYNFLMYFNKFRQTMLNETSLWLQSTSQKIQYDVTQRKPIWYMYLYELILCLIETPLIFKKNCLLQRRHLMNVLLGLIYLIETLVKAENEAWFYSQVTEAVSLHQ